MKFFYRIFYFADNVVFQLFFQNKCFNQKNFKLHLKPEV
jgi:hypothetical protein